MEKSVSEQKLQNHNEEVEELAGDEAAEVNVVPEITLNQQCTFS